MLAAGPPITVATVVVTAAKVVEGLRVIVGIGAVIVGAATVMVVRVKPTQEHALD